MDGGSSLADASSVITYISPADFIGRMILPLLADRNYIRRGTLVTLSFCVMGVSTMALPQTTSFATLLPTCVVFGIALGCLLTMEIVLVSDYVDVQLFAVCYGFCSLASIPGILVGPLVFGFFRDSMGTYDNMYRLIGGIHLAVGLIFGAVVWNEKRSGRTEQTTKL
ncbi:monocarboxylate transporter 2 [Ixodes scapularis]